MIIKRISEEIFLILARNNGKFPYAHSLLLGKNDFMLVDTGLGEKDLLNLKKKYRIKYVFNTHYHWDHISGNRFFHDCIIWAHKLDAPAINSLKINDIMMGVDGRPDRNDIVNDLKKMICRDGAKCDEVFEDGHNFIFDELIAEAYHLPGHTPGHTGIYFPTERILFSADICLDNFGPNYGHKASDIRKYLASIERIKKEKKDILLTSHSEPVIENINEKLDDYKRILFKRCELLLTYLETPKSINEIVDKRIHYPKSQWSPCYKFFEEMMIINLLNYLIEEKKIVKEGEKFVRR